MPDALNTIKLNEPYYHREYKNDEIRTSSKLLDCLNLALLVLPNISKAFSQPIAVGSGALRSWSYWSRKDKGNAEIGHAVFATTALAATFFKHPLGMILTTAQDLSLELTELYNALKTNDPQKIKEHCLNAINHILYLIIFLKGGLELVILSLILQTVVALYRSYHAHLAGDRFKLVLQLLTVAFRCNQLRGQINLLNLTRELVKKGSTFKIIKLKPLGSGSHGDVFLAQRSDNTLIAVKRYHPQSTYDNGSFLTRVYIDLHYYSNGINNFAEKELILGKKFDHPNIVKLYDQAVQFDDAGNPQTFLLMEYIEQKTESQNPQDSIKNCLQFMDALRAGFNAGYIHVDLHQENILIDAKGDLKLIDIDSFENISQNHDLKNKKHLKEVVSTLGDFLKTHEHNTEIEESLKKIIKSDEIEGQKHISKESPSTYFLPMFERIEAVLKSYS